MHDKSQLSNSSARSISADPVAMRGEITTAVDPQRITDRQATASRQHSQGFREERKGLMAQSMRLATQANGNEQSRSVHNGCHPEESRLPSNRTSTGRRPPGDCPSSRSSTSIWLMPNGSFRSEESGKVRKTRHWTCRWTGRALDSLEAVANQSCEAAAQDQPIGESAQSDSFIEVR